MKIELLKISGSIVDTASSKEYDVLYMTEAENIKGWTSNLFSKLTGHPQLPIFYKAEKGKFSIDDKVWVYTDLEKRVIFKVELRNPEMVEVAKCKPIDYFSEFPKGNQVDWANQFLEEYEEQNPYPANDLERYSWTINLMNSYATACHVHITKKTIKPK